MTPEAPEVRAWDPEFFLPEEPSLVDWDSVLGRSAPLVIEIGTGNGLFLADEAARRPEINFLGIERAKEFFTKCRKRIGREGIRNARCIHADANDVLGGFVRPQSVAGVICNFSDPWPKRRHRGRRVFVPEFVALLERVIVPGGTLAFKTDVAWYFNLTVHLLRGRLGWSFAEIGPKEEVREAEDVETNFQRRAREAGIQVWGFVAVWNGPAGK